MLDQLNQTELFHDLRESDLKEISKFCARLELQDGEILIQENAKSHFDLFLLCEGYVEIVSNSNAVISNEVVISKNQKELLGEVSWLNNDERTATVRCRGPVEVIRVDGDQLKNYIEKNHEVGYLIMRQIAILLSLRLSATNTVLKQILWNICL
jgi:CRP-like cAMP-binding protein